MTIFGPRATRRYVLRADDGEAAGDRFAIDHGWDPLTRDFADPDRGAEYRVSWLTDGPVTFHYQEDNILREGYVFLAGRDLPAVERYEQELVAAIEHWTLEELLDEVDRQPAGPGRGRAILRAGMGAPMRLDHRFYEVFVDAMHSEVSPVRAIGVRACAYSPLPEYLPDLEQLAGDDDAQDVRDLAEATLRAFDEFGIGQP